MSSAYAYVRLADGTLHQTIYHGTVDVLHADLWPLSAPWSMMKRGPLVPYVECGCERQEAEVWNTFGGEWGWKVEACKHEVYTNHQPYGCEDWNTGEWLAEPVETFKDEPAWMRDVRAELASMESST